ncbi:TonB-dependent receptor domain-containing protein [Pontibacter sp. SGAir0037]|uniref:TonB-dependent receptor domain-containing protein n=1 Tax=Pontibacter sp. SGAir0037 TaxID=2571030 RepID=UPI0010CCF676|nr:TonB-dependent receptor [Pontibacter sp. SGAir0037]QCR25061.1 TonB-dependent receptor [Pontibacter sp. SGAir0037]
MKKNILLLILGLSTTAVFAQAPATPQNRPQPQTAATAVAPKGNAKISGVVLDAETNKPVEYATIALISVATGKPVDGTMADEKGRFTITKVAAGSYKVQATFLSYKPTVIEGVSVASDNDNVNLGTISLASDAKKLSEVVVSGEKPLVEEQIDKTVYNAEKDITNAGGTAADVLQKVPSLSVDTDGNVQLRGSSNVRVLINNKPSAIMAGSIADALKQIPADQIKSVEVITSPSAKYDAEGTAGIINIITKREGGLQGVTGSVALTGGTRSSNGNASLNIKRGKLGINGTFGGNMFYNRGSLTNSIVSDSSNNYQAGASHINGAFMNGQLGFEYDINPQNSISGGIRSNGGSFRMENQQDVRNLLIEKDGTLKESNFKNEIRNKTQRLGTDYNLDYTHYFKKPQQELAILSLYSVSPADNQVSQDYGALGEAPFQTVRNTNESTNKELTFQVDYTHPFVNKTILEVGAKSIFRDAESDARNRSVSTSPAETIALHTIFNYQQNVYASYLTYGFTLKKKLNVKLGGRYEFTDISSEMQTEGTKQNALGNYARDYDNIIPSVALSYTLKGAHTFKANFTQRIQRPSLFYLNPYLQEQTSNTRVQGNPNLDAELTNLYELGYSTYFKTTSISTSLYMRQTDNAIETIANIDRVQDANGNLKDVTTLSFDNIAKNKTYGASIFGSTKPTNDWTLSGSSNIFYMDLKSSIGSNSGWMYNINANSSYNFGKGISAQFNGGFNSRRVQLLGEFASFSYHSLAFKKELFDKKGGIAIGLDNPFREALRMKTNVRVAEARNAEGEIITRGYVQNIENVNYNRGFRVTFNYAFGKLDQQRPPKRKKSIRNDDAKQGDSGVN